MENKLIIDLEKKAVKGYCKGNAGFKAQIEALRGLV